MPIAQFSGLASGIDSNALIDAIIKARESTNEIRKKDISHLESENESLDEFNTKLLALNDLIDKFRTANGGGIDKKSASSDSTVATAAVSTSAINASYSLTVTAIADTATASFDDTYSSLTDVMAPNAVGTQTIGVDVGTTPTSVNVDITNTTTISEYVTNFNADANAANNVVASIVNVGTEASPSYRIMFNTLQSGLDNGQIAFNIASAAVGFGGNSDLQNRTVDQAANSSFSVSGIATPITRATNAVSDVVSGVTFNLSKAGSAEITVSDDASSTSDDVNEIVDAFNELVKFVDENNTVTRVESNNQVDNIYGSLAKTRVDDDFISAFRLEISSASSTNGTSVTSMAELGLSTNRDGSISFDADKFKTAVSEDATGAGEVLTSFADSVAGISGMINQYTRFDGFIDLAQEGNNTEIQNLNAAIAQLDRFNAAFKESLTLKFASLESRVGALQSQGQALTNILAGLG